MRRVVFLLSVLAVAFAVPGDPGAILQLSGGHTILGVRDFGSLNAYYREVPAIPPLFSPDGDGEDPAQVGFVGLRYDYMTAVEKGCQCEGWGVRINSSLVDFGDSWADYSDTWIVGGGGLSADAIEGTDGGTWATARSNYFVFDFVHDFYPSASQYAFEIEVSITNNWAWPVDITYRRVIDWDIDPTPFNEIITVRGAETASHLIDTCDDGKKPPSPSTPGVCVLANHSKSYEFLGPADHGNYFDFFLQNIRPDETRTFYMYYGSAPNRLEAERALAILELEVESVAYSSGCSDLPNTTACINNPVFFWGYKGSGAPSQAPPTIYAMYLNGSTDVSGGAFLVIEGKDFGTVNSDLTVTINTGSGFASCSSPTLHSTSKLVCIVPSGLDITGLAITVIRKGLSSDYLGTWNYGYPEITSVSCDSATGLATINGYHLGTNTSKMTIYVGGILCSSPSVLANDTVVTCHTGVSGDGTQQVIFYYDGLSNELHVPTYYNCYADQWANCSNWISANPGGIISHPDLDYSKVKLDSNGYLQLFWDWPLVRERNLTFAGLLGNLCTAGLTDDYTIEGDCRDRHLDATYNWMKLLKNCPGAVQVQNTTNGIMATMYVELQFQEPFQVDDGAKRDVFEDRSIYMRQFVEDYPIQILTPTSLTLSGSVSACFNVPCVALDQCHVAGICDNQTGICTNPNAADGTTCSDSNLCTSNDTCALGSCVGIPKVCDPVPCHSVTCDSGTGNCVSTPLTGVSCNDGDECTLSDTCQSGVCVGTPKACVASDSCHDAGSCNPADGVCSNPAKEDGSACDADNNLCTLGDSCSSGVCVAGSPKVCTALDQCHDAGTCEPSTGICSDPAKSNGTPCDDSNLCTLIDTCQSGICTGPLLNCPATAPDDCHTTNGTCNPTDGQCVYSAKPDGQACDDSDLCTTTDQCVAGACVGSPVSCTTSDSCFVSTGSCDPSDGECVFQPLSDDTPCSDGDACTLADRCVGGLCVPNGAVACPPQTCKTVFCNVTTGSCIYQPLTGSPCDDGNACTSLDTCQSGVCVGSAIPCFGSNECYKDGQCDPSTGCITNSPKDNGAACNDGDLCTQVDYCDGAGTCTGTDPVVCNANTQCQEPGTCEDGTCSYANKDNGSPCDDSDGCTIGDNCQAGTCVPGTPKDCGAAPACHSYTCSAGNCIDNNIADGTGCDDLNVCTQTDSCSGGVCVGSNNLVCTGTPGCADAAYCDSSSGCVDPCTSGLCDGVVCTASDQCHKAGICDPETGTCSDPKQSDGYSCDDGDGCTTTDGCLDGSCSGVPVDCSYLDDQCGVGLCDGGSCVYSPYGSIHGCDDGDYCTVGDHCNGNGACIGDPRDCGGAIDACHDTPYCSAGACHNDPKSGTPCSDGSLCTADDTCVAGVCTGTPVICPALTCKDEGTCDPSDGSCDYSPLPDDTPCSDDDMCTTGDSCQSGSCQGTQTTCDSPPDQCHSPGTCNSATGLCDFPAKPDDTSCDDFSACTSGETCQVGVCTPASTVTCSALDECHDVGTCDTLSGICSNPTKSDTASCDDHNACTDGDHCSAGVCVAGPPTGCPGDQCNDADCNVVTGCYQIPKNGTSCNDNNLCTQTDICLSGTCTGFNTKICSTNTTCYSTSGTCNPATGSCSFTTLPDGTSCNADNDKCTPNDTCHNGTCIADSYHITCTALDQCHLPGTCNPFTGICSNPFQPNGHPCVDNNACTIDGQCQTGSCLTHTIICSPVGTCAIPGVCQIATGNCSDPCGTWSLNGFVISQIIPNYAPYTINFGTVTSMNKTLVDCQLLYSPADSGTAVISVDHSKDTYRNGTVTQFWQLLWTPDGSYCSLDGVYTIQCTAADASVNRVSLGIEAPNLCGIVVHANITGTLGIFGDAARTLASSIFVATDTIYFTVTLSSQGQNITSLELYNATFGNSPVPLNVFTIEGGTPISILYKFVLASLTVPDVIQANALANNFLGKQTLRLTVRFALDTFGKREVYTRTIEADPDETYNLAGALWVREASTGANPTPSDKPSTPEHSTSSSNSATMIVGVTLGSVAACLCTLLLAFFVRYRKSVKAYEMKEEEN